MYDKVLNDRIIVNLYRRVSQLEESFGIYCKHSLSHVKNVAYTVEHILKCLDCNDEIIEDAKIASILHDIGCILGKDNHEKRSYEMAKFYIESNSIKLSNKRRVLNAIRNHRDGFKTNNIITLAVIFADKIDLSKNRLSKLGYDIEGARQMRYIKKVETNITDGNLIVQFITESKFDKLDFEKFYFIPKVFIAISSFAKKFNLKPLILINNEEWLCPSLAK
jgi:HD superfamily phosphohydrolase YqeK